MVIYFYPKVWSINILIPIITNINPPIISALDPILSENLEPNRTQIKLIIQVTIQIIRAGMYISLVLATSDAPTASASILVAKPSISSDFSQKIFLSIFSSGVLLYHAAIIFHPIYPRSKNAIQ